MNEERIRQVAHEQGYVDLQSKDYVPNTDGPLHRHDFSVIVLIVEGHFTLAFENGTSNYLPGDVCELAANVMHTERAGPEGAKVLLANQHATRGEC